MSCWMLGGPFRFFGFGRYLAFKWVTEIPVASIGITEPNSARFSTKLVEAASNQSRNMDSIAPRMSTQFNDRYNRILSCMEFFLLSTIFHLVKILQIKYSRTASIRFIHVFDYQLRSNNNWTGRIGHVTVVSRRLTLAHIYSLF